MTVTRRETATAAARWTLAHAIKAERNRMRDAHAAAVDAAVRAAKRVDRGSEIEVVRGRKIPRGTTGVAFWVGETKFGTRVGFRTAAGESLFTALTNVVVANPDEFFEMPDAPNVNARVRSLFFAARAA